jgi:hypothetical protein
VMPVKTWGDDWATMISLWATELRRSTLRL